MQGCRQPCTSKSALMLNQSERFRKRSAISPKKSKPKRKQRKARQLKAEKSPRKRKAEKKPQARKAKPNSRQPAKKRLRKKRKKSRQSRPEKPRQKARASSYAVSAAWSDDGYFAALSTHLFYFRISSSQIKRLLNHNRLL